MNESKQFRLRIVTAESHRIEHRPAHEFIVHAAFDRGLAGATVTRGIAGYGHSHHVHTAKILDISADLPIVTEIIDESAKIEGFAAWIRTLYTRGSVVVDEVRSL